MGGQPKRSERPSELRSPSDTDLALGLKAGLPEAQNEFFKRYWPRLRGFCRARLRDRELADEMVQDTLTRALDAIESFTVGEPFWPWLSTIARRLCIDAARGIRRRPPPESLEALAGRPGSHEPRLKRWPHDETSETAEQVVRAATLRSALTAGLSTMSPQARRILWLHEEQELGYAAIAESEGITIHAARNLAFRARNQLRKSLEHIRRDLLGLAGVLALVRRKTKDGHQRMRQLIGAVQFGTFAVPIADRVMAVLSAAALAASLYVLGLPGAAAPPLRGGPTPEQFAAVLIPARTDEMVIALEVAHAPSPIGRAALGARVDHKENAAVPSRTTIGFFIEGPDGQTLIWKDTGIECGDGTQWQYLPREGPLHSTC